MPQYDGSIRINTKIEAKNAEKELKSLESSITKTAGKIASLRSKMDALKDVKVPTQEYKEVQRQIEATEKKINDLMARQEKFLETGGKETSSTYQRMRYDLEELRESLPYLKGELQDLVESGKAFTLGSDTEKYAQMSAQIQQLNQQMASDMERQAQLQDSLTEREQRLADIKSNATVSDREIISLLERRKELVAEIAILEEAGVGRGYKEYDDKNRELERINAQIKEYGANLSSPSEKFREMRNVAKKTFNSIHSGLSKIGNLGKKVFSSIVNSAKRAFSTITGGSKQSNASLSGGLKTILKYGLGIRSLYALFNKIRVGIQQGFTNLMGYSDGFANSIQSVKNSMSTLGNQIAAAFAPIIQTVIPWLNSLINVLAKAITYLAQFIALLSGKSTFTRAKKVQDSYNKSLGGTAAAAKKAAGALAAFDKLNVLNKKDDGGGGGGGGGIDTSDMFEEVSISDKFKEMWENADFTELGAAIGQKLKDALNSIPWREIKATAKKIGASLATLLNGFFEVPELGEKIGKTIAETFNTIWALFDGFFEKFHGSSFGQFLTDILNGFFEGIDWETINRTVKNALTSLSQIINKFATNKRLWNNLAKFVTNIVKQFTNLYNFFKSTKFKELGKNIGKTLQKIFNDIDWKKVGETIGAGIRGLADLIFGAIEEIDFVKLGKDFADAVNGLFKEVDMKKLGKEFNTLFKGLLDFAIEAIGSIDWEQLGTAFGEAIEGLRPKMIELAKKLAEAFFKALGAAFKSAPIETTIISVFALLKWTGITSSLFNVLASKVGKGISTAISSYGGWGAIGESIMSFIQPAAAVVVSAVAGWNIGVLIGEEIQKSLLPEEMQKYRVHYDFKDWIDISPSEWVQGFKDFANDVFGNKSVEKEWENGGRNLSAGVKKGLEEGAKGIDDVVTKNLSQPMINRFQSDFEMHSPSALMARQGKNIMQGLINGMQGLLSSLLGKVTSIKERTVGKFSNIKENMAGVGKNIINGIIEGIMSVWDKLKGWADKIKSMFNINVKLPGVSTSGSAGSAVKSAVPQLATGAVIRGGNPFMAVLGDQPAGQTNIETPLPTMVQAFKQALAESGWSGNGKEASPEVYVYIGNDQLDDYIVRSSRLGALRGGGV